MKRLMKRMIVLFVVLFWVLPALAQDVPVVTPEAEAPPDLSALDADSRQALPVLQAVRADLDLLATNALGAERPVGWSGASDPSDPALSIAVRLDLEVLTGALGGTPAGWFGVVPSVPLAVARDLRHDLELLADRVTGSPFIRPNGWIGDDPIYRCSRGVQALYIALARIDGLTFPIDFTSSDFCATAELAASRYVERAILQPPPASVIELGADGVRVEAFGFRAERPFMVAFLDREARQQTGVLPVETGFRAVARSGARGSNMMLIEGTGFRLFVDRTTSPVTATQFLALPEIAPEQVEPTFCTAEWCTR